MTYPRIELVDSLQAVAECTMAVGANEFPGFQVRPDFARRVGTLPILDTIEGATEATLGRLIPFTTIYSTATDKDVTQDVPHTDGGFRWLSMHRNQAEEGRLQLAHYVGPEIVMTAFEKLPATDETYRGGDIETRCPPELRGQIYEGDLSPDILTVFSQGHIGGLQPAIHYFWRPVGVPIAWTRYGSASGDDQLSPDELQLKVSNLRSRILHDEM